MAAQDDRENELLRIGTIKFKNSLSQEDVIQMCELLNFNPAASAASFGGITWVEIMQILNNYGKIDNGKSVEEFDRELKGVVTQGDSLTELSDWLTKWTKNHKSQNFKADEQEFKLKLRQQLNKDIVSELCDWLKVPANVRDRACNNSQTGKWEEFIQKLKNMGYIDQFKSLKQFESTLKAGLNKYPQLQKVYNFVHDWAAGKIN